MVTLETRRWFRLGDLFHDATPDGCPTILDKQAYLRALALLAPA